MKKHVIEVYRLYWSKNRSAYLHPATGLSREDLMRAAKEQFKKCDIEYIGEKRDICKLTIYVKVGG